MQISAGQWYTSGTFWAAAAVVVSALSAGAAGWVAFRVANPKRRLVYGLSKASPLIARHHGELGEHSITVSSGEQVLDQPYVLDIQLANQGRRDIPSSAFDTAEPIRLDVGCTIVAILRSPSMHVPRRTLLRQRSHILERGAGEPRARLVVRGVYHPRVEVDGTALKIGPSLLPKRQKFSLTLLVNGYPQLTCEAHLIDVEVREQIESVDVPPSVTLVASLITGLLATGAVTVADATAPAVMGTTTTLATVSVILVWRIVRAWRRQDRSGLAPH